MRDLDAILADYAVGSDDPGYEAAGERLAHDAGDLLAALGSVRALIPHWTDEIHDGHGAYRAGLAKAAEQLVRALGGAE